MTALAARCGRLHGAAGRPAKRQPEGRRGLPGRVPAPARLRAGDHRHRPGQVVVDDLDAPAHQRLPGPPGVTARRDDQDAEQPAGRRTRCSAPPPRAGPEHAALIQRVLAIRPSARPGRSSPTWGATETRRCWRRSRLGGASPNSPAWGDKTSSSKPTPAAPAKAQAALHAVSRWIVCRVTWLWSSGGPGAPRRPHRATRDG